MIIPVFDELKTSLRQSKLPLGYVAYRAGVHRKTITRWLEEEIFFPRIDTMLKVAAVLGQHIKLTPRVEKMVTYYPRPTIRPAPPISIRGMTRHNVRAALQRLQ